MNSELKQDLSGITPEMVFEAVKAFRLDKEPREAMYDALAAALAVKSSAAQEAVAWQRRWADADGLWFSISKEIYEATQNGKWADRYEVRALYAAPAPAPVTAAPAVAYLIDGRTEQGLTFDKAAAETMAFANGGTVRALGFVDGTPAAPGIDLTPLWRLSDAWLKEPDGERQSPGENRLRWAMAKELRDALTLLDASPKGGSEARDTARLDWLESEVRHYGDGHTEPREAYVGFNWQESRGCEVFPGVRAAIDAAMQAQAGDAEVQP